MTNDIKEIVSFLKTDTRKMHLKQIERESGETDRNTQKKSRRKTDVQKDFERNRNIKERKNKQTKT